MIDVEYNRLGEKYYLRKRVTMIGPNQLFLSTMLTGLPILQTLTTSATDGLVNVANVDSSISVDLRYATTNNFTGQKIYPQPVCLLRAATAAKLASANVEFRAQGYRLKIWDAYRPPNAQQLLWNLVQDTRYAANPATGGSRHSRGGAVDLTLVDEHGAELVMPSDFDDFSQRASRDNPAMTAEAASNLTYLTEVMVRHGFRPYVSEWWHFEDTDAEGFFLLNVKLDEYRTDQSSGLSQLDPAVSQALVVRGTTPGRPAAVLAIWERQIDGWQQNGKAIAVVVGRNGFATPGNKREGDGKSPSGTYVLDLAFGYPPAIDSAMPYRQALADDYWVDDPQSPEYNQWVHGIPHADSFERLKRDDDLYQLGLVVEYNTKPAIPFLGSAIFIHVWRGPDSSTDGCVAMPKETLRRLLAWLDPAKRPVISIGE